MTGFVGEFHALMGAFRGPIGAFGNIDFYRTTAIISTGVVILSAWYMLWLFQRVAQGTAPGLQLAHAHAGHGHDAGHDDHGHAEEQGGDQSDHPHHATPESPAEQAAEAAAHDPAAAASHDMHLTDVKPREIVTLAPLLVLTILFGVFPGPIFQLAAPTLQNLLTAFK
jgi:NADH-quinone oxidoreductase subunit M